jgi:hypothetical protein
MKKTNIEIMQELSVAMLKLEIIDRDLTEGEEKVLQFLHDELGERIQKIPQQKSREEMYYKEQTNWDD